MPSSTRRELKLKAKSTRKQLLVKRTPTPCSKAQSTHLRLTIFRPGYCSHHKTPKILACKCLSKAVPSSNSRAPPNSTKPPRTPRHQHKDRSTNSSSKDRRHRLSSSGIHFKAWETCRDPKRTQSCHSEDSTCLILQL